MEGLMINSIKIAWLKVTIKERFSISMELFR
jgi:hypothetical protein